MPTILDNLPAQLSIIKKQVAHLTGWEKEAVQGYIYMRDGKDYVNNGQRYDKAYELLSSAYNYLKQHKPEERISLAKLSLWKGISLNENLDIQDMVVRNDRAIEEYKTGLRYLQHVRDPVQQVLPIRMSLHNSLGVANHHRYGEHGSGRVPAISFTHYRTAGEIYKKLPTNPWMLKIMKKVEHNSGGHIHRDPMKKIIGGNCSYV
jgi:hypothetical protein